jgi:hypothetical protein
MIEDIGKVAQFRENRILGVIAAFAVPSLKPTART